MHIFTYKGKKVGLKRTRMQEQREFHLEKPRWVNPWMERQMHRRAVEAQEREMREYERMMEEQRDALMAELGTRLPAGLVVMDGSGNVMAMGSAGEFDLDMDEGEEAGAFPALGDLSLLEIDEDEGRKEPTLGDLDDLDIEQGD